MVSGASEQTLIVPEYGSVFATGFDNAFYPSYEYIGSRVLEHESVRYRQFRWTQAGDVDDLRPGATGKTYLVDPTYHVLLELVPNSTYFPFPTWSRVVSGLYGRSGYFDGIRHKSLFNVPMGVSIGAKGDIYIADSHNHAVRMLSFSTKTERVSTLAGGPERPGLMDGPGEYAKLRYPTNIGNYQDQIFVLDNHSRVRLIYAGNVITLVDGVCRSVRKRIYPLSIVIREVGCHEGWNIHRTSDRSIPYFSHQTMCTGHAGTCAPRDLPALADRHVPNLLTVEESKTQTVVSMGSDNRRLEANQTDAKTHVVGRKTSVAQRTRSGPRGLVGQKSSLTDPQMRKTRDWGVL